MAQPELHARILVRRQHPARRERSIESVCSIRVRNVDFRRVAAGTSPETGDSNGSNAPPIVGSPWKMRGQNPVLSRPFSSDEPGSVHRDEIDCPAFSVPIASEDAGRRNTSFINVWGSVVAAGTCWRR